MRVTPFVGPSLCVTEPDRATRAPGTKDGQFVVVPDEPARPAA